MKQNKKQTKRIHHKKLSTLFLFIGVVMLTFNILFRIKLQENQKLHTEVISVPAQSYVEEIDQKTPVQVNINQLLSQAVSVETYSQGQWTIADDTASFLNSSARPGQKGNIIIYGHNKKDIFGHLHSVQKGQILTITTKDTETYSYKITDILIVDPEETEALQVTDYEVVTLYTCTGFLDRKRLVVRAVPVSSEHI